MMLLVALAGRRLTRCLPSPCRGLLFCEDYPIGSDAHVSSAMLRSDWRLAWLRMSRMDVGIVKLIVVAQNWPSPVLPALQGRAGGTQRTHQRCSLAAHQR